MKFLLDVCVSSRWNRINVADGQRYSWKRRIEVMSRDADRGEHVLGMLAAGDTPQRLIEE
jgi:hypothetical protein